MTVDAQKAVLVWSMKGRALAGVFVPLLAWLSFYSFTSVTQPSPGG